jgi:hypothetical protein
MSALFAILFSALALASSGEGCRLPPEQGAGSMIGSWEKLPITLVADRGLYANDHGSGAAALRSAVKTWNDWAATKGKVAFVIQNDLKSEKGGMLIPELTSCSQADYTNAVPGAVGIWKIGRSGPSANARPTCGIRRAKLIADGVQAQTDWNVDNRIIRNASILLNFDYFQADGRPKVDLESLLVHELGHVLGLLHSCNSSSDDAIDGTSSPACDASPKEFVEAAMFPYLRRGTVRRSIQTNDLDRVSCLY